MQDFYKRTGKPVEAIKSKTSKYHAKRTNGHASKHEDDVAAELHMRELAETVTVMEQVPFKLSGGVKYVADFVLLLPNGRYEVLDAKGVLTEVYRIKKKQLKEIWGNDITEV